VSSGAFKLFGSHQAIPIWDSRIWQATDPAFDLGGLLNSTLASALAALRFRDTIIHYNSSTITVSGQTIPSPGEVRNNFQFSTAIAFRF